MAVFFTRRGPAPVLGKLLSDYAVGESVFLAVDGALREFIVVNQGIPGNSSLYDSSCDGTWLMMKDAYAVGGFDSNGSLTNYEAKFNEDVQAVIKQVKIPFIATMGGTVANYSAKVFLPSFDEVCVYDSGYSLGDGALLSYFSGLTAKDTTDKRAITYNGTSVRWWVRTRYKGAGENANRLIFNEDGRLSGFDYSGSSYGIRPTLVMSFEALFDPDTNEFLKVT